MYQYMSQGKIGTIIVAREDRLFRDKHMGQVATFTDKAEQLKVCVIVPPVGLLKGLRYYDFTNFTHLRAFQDKMIAAYDYIETHVVYMHAAKHNKSSRGCYDGRKLPPGLAVPLWIDKSDQKPVVYEPWAEIMRGVFQRWKELDYSIPRLNKEISELVFLFPDVPEDDSKKFLMRTNLRKVEGGYKPAYSGTLKKWFKNPALIGWWIVSEQSREAIIDNHEAIIDREDFEPGYIKLTGHNLDGDIVDVTRIKRHQSRKGKDEPNAVLRFLLTSPNAKVYPTSIKNKCCYRGVRRSC